MNTTRIDNANRSVRTAMILCPRNTARQDIRWASSLLTPDDRVIVRDRALFKILSPVPFTTAWPFCPRAVPQPLHGSADRLTLPTAPLHELGDAADERRTLLERRRGHFYASPIERPSGPGKSRTGWLFLRTKTYSASACAFRKDSSVALAGPMMETLRSSGVFVSRKVMNPSFKFTSAHLSLGSSPPRIPRRPRVVQPAEGARGLLRIRPAPKVLAGCIFLAKRKCGTG